MFKKISIAIAMMATVATINSNVEAIENICAAMMPHHCKITSCYDGSVLADYSYVTILGHQVIIKDNLE